MSVGNPSPKLKSLTTGREDEGSSKDGFLTCPNCLKILVGIVLPNSKSTQDFVCSSRNSLPDNRECKNTKAKSTDANITTLETFFPGCSISLTDEDMVALKYVTSSAIKYSHPEKVLPSYRRAQCDENKMLIELHVRKLLNPLNKDSE